MNSATDTTQALRLPGETDGAAEDLVQRLEQLNAIGASLSAERDINRLLESILVAAKTITRRARVTTTGIQGRAPKCWSASRTAAAHPRTVPTPASAPTRASRAVARTTPATAAVTQPA